MPSAVRLPTTATCIPLASSKPLKRKAYWPFNSDLLTPAAVTVMVALAVLVMSVAEVAVSVTVVGDGKVEGAV